MAPRASSSRLSHWPLTGLAAAVVIAGSTFALTAPSAATAKREHPRSGGSSQPAAAVEVQASPAAGSAVAAATPPASTTSTASGTHRRARTAPAAVTTTGSVVSESTASGTHRVHSGQAKAHRSAGNTSTQTGVEAGSGAVAAPAARVPRARGPHHKGGGRGGEPGRAKEPKHGRAPQPVPGGGTPTGQSTPAAPVPAPVPVSAPAPSIPAPVVQQTPVAVTPSPSTPVTHGGRAHTRARRPRPAVVGAAPALAAALVASGAPATRAGSAVKEERHAASPAKPKPSTESPLVRTVTKIIGVVPPIVRALIAALVALALALGAALGSRRCGRAGWRASAASCSRTSGCCRPRCFRLCPAAWRRRYLGGLPPRLRTGRGRRLLRRLRARGRAARRDRRRRLRARSRSAAAHDAVRFTLRAYLEAGLSPRRSLQAAAPVLERQLGGLLRDGRLATYDPRERLLIYACAGHPPRS